VCSPSGRDRAQVDLGLPFDEEPDDVDAWAGRAVVLAEAEDDAALVLVGDPHALEKHDEHQQDDDGFDDMGGSDGERKHAAS
jgi:hypothetical protein